MDRVIPVVVLFSGRGSNLEALIEELHGRRIPKGEIRIVPITNNPEAEGIQRAEKHSLRCEVIDHRRFETREAFDTELVATIRRHRPALTVMAGFMRILTPVFTSQIDAVNLHPSLLPLFKGARAIEKSFESGMKVGGITVHRVSQELDSGEILAQVCVPIEAHDSLETFKAKIHEAEHRLLPATVLRMLEEIKHI